MGKLVSFSVDLVRPWTVRIFIILIATFELYDAASNQFDWPKIPVLWGMTGSPDPLWAWLLAAIVFALFEYVRRNVATAGDTLATPEHLNGQSIESSIAASVVAHMEQNLWLKQFRAEKIKEIKDHAKLRLQQYRELPETKEISVQRKTSRHAHYVKCAAEALGFDTEKRLQEAQERLEKTTNWVLPPSENESWPTLDEKRDSLRKDLSIRLFGEMLDGNPDMEPQENALVKQINYREF
ncbi:hypothetical protein [uncultured Parasphingorhabdus sp.]|uniref:hypothetical protein n=1 Tax=uncultured Parasphingorhabdus sp. TaxID=2709694 RepID=UPI0030DDBC2B|tara:strand:+ start:79518 stop:80234 length:717 start_codon:yes stop_codon:yes gene_type:complete